MADDIVAPIEAEEWGVTELASLEDHARQHDHKGHSEEMCVRCGWVMGHRPLNCQNDDTPHVFPSQEAEIERLQHAVDELTSAFQTLTDMGDDCPMCWDIFKKSGQQVYCYGHAIIAELEEARRG